MLSKAKLLRGKAPFPSRCHSDFGLNSFFSDSEPVSFHSSEEVRVNLKARCRSYYRVDTAFRADCSLAHALDVIDPYFDIFWGKQGQAVKTATGLARENRRTIFHAVTMSLDKIGLVHQWPAFISTAPATQTTLPPDTAISATHRRRSIHLSPARPPNFHQGGKRLQCVFPDRPAKQAVSLV